MGRHTTKLLLLLPPPPLLARVAQSGAARPRMRPLSAGGGPRAQTPAGSGCRLQGTAYQDWRVQSGMLPQGAAPPEASQGEPEQLAGSASASS